VTVRLGLLVGLLVAAALAGCSPTVASGPPEIKYGRDVCVECGMIANEAKFAASYRLDGEEYVFDDIGDLIMYARKNGIDLDPSQTWVHDYETAEAVDVAHAVFVPTASVATPMGHGIVAFADAARAERYAADLGGEVIGWDTVMALPIENNLVGDHRRDGSGGMNLGDADMDMGDSMSANR